MARPKITVTTAVGTFSRQTARGYQFVLVANGRSEWWIDQNIAYELPTARENVAYFRGMLSGAKPRAMNYNVAAAAGEQPHPYTDAECATHLAKDEALLAALEDGSERARRLSVAEAAPYAVLSWCSRLDLARKEAARWSSHFRSVRIFSIAGDEVR